MHPGLTGHQTGKSLMTLRDTLLETNLPAGDPVDPPAFLKLYRGLRSLAAMRVRQEKLPAINGPFTAIKSALAHYEREKYREATGRGMPPRVLMTHEGWNRKARRFAEKQQRERGSRHEVS